MKKKNKETWKRETESKRDLKQMKRVSFTIYVNYRESAHSCERVIMEINLSSTAHSAFSAFHLNRLAANAGDLNFAN